MAITGYGTLAPGGTDQRKDFRILFDPAETNNTFGDGHELTGELVDKTLAI